MLYDFVRSILISTSSHIWLHSCPSCDFLADHVVIVDISALKNESLVQSVRQSWTLLYAWCFFTGHHHSQDTTLDIFEIMSCVVCTVLISLVRGMGRRFLRWIQSSLPRKNWGTPWKTHLRRGSPGLLYFVDILELSMGYFRVLRYISFISYSKDEFMRYLYWGGSFSCFTTFLWLAVWTLMGLLAFVIWICSRPSTHMIVMVCGGDLF